MYDCLGASYRRCVCIVQTISTKKTSTKALQRGGGCDGALEYSNSSVMGDTKPLSPACFLQPVQGISLTDLQCIQCNCIADRPVQISCGKLVSYKCITVCFKTPKSEINCRGTDHHSSSFSTASEMLVKILSTFILHCSKCTAAVELRSIRTHMASSCALTFPLSPYHLTCNVTAA